MATRHQNRGLRKICDCPRRTWAKCAHSWHFNYKVRGGASFRFSVDSEVGKHIASKTEAEALADRWRNAIREGTFRRRRADAPAAPAHAAPHALTVAAVSEKYAERATQPLNATDRARLRRLAGHDGLGEKPLAAVTDEDIEVFLARLKAEGLASSTRNKYVQVLSAMFRWATKKGYLAKNPIADSDTIKREKHAKRNRRLEIGEEGRLLAVAPPHLQRLIIAALETGCRRGELLALTWRDVNLQRREITVRAETSKTRTARVLPVSARLAAVLEMARLDPAGQAYTLEAFVFGELGQRLKTFKRAWQTAVVKAAGHTPQWTAQNALSATSQAVFRAVDLHFHDLRHEAGSRLLEAGWPLHNVAHMLGHANIAQTSTYLNATRIGLQDSMRRLDAARGCNPVASEGVIDPAPGGGAIVQNSPEPLIN